MTVLDLGTKVTYRWQVRIPPKYKTPLNDVIEWINENKISGTIFPGVAFFNNEQDAIIFILRWS